MMISSTGNSPLTGEWLLPSIDLSCTEKISIYCLLMGNNEREGKMDVAVIAHGS